MLFLNMGGPETLPEVRPFLRNLFSDRDIIPLPFGKRAMRAFGWAFSTARAPYAKRTYALIGGGSPQRRTSEAQARAVAARLDLEAPGLGPWRSYVAMRYAAPSTDEAIAAIREDGIERLVVLPLYPHFSTVSTGSSLAELARGFRRAGFMPREVVTVRDYHDDPGYLGAVAAGIERALDGLAREHRDEALVLFSAHALPMRVVRRGDPYPAQIEATVRAVVERLARPNPVKLAWQSQARPFVTWLEPRTDLVLEELGREGRKTVVAVPIAFVQEHIETLYELDILYGDLARRAGIERYVRVPALGEDPAFMGALAAVVRRVIGHAPGTRVAPHASQEARPCA